MILPGGLFESLTLKRMHETRIGRQPITPKALGPLPFRPGCRILALTGDALGVIPMANLIKASIDDTLERTADSLARSLEPAIHKNAGAGAGCIIGSPISLR